MLAILIDANTWIKGVQIGDHEIKILNSPMTPPFSYWKTLTATPEYNQLKNHMK